MTSRPHWKNLAATDALSIALLVGGYMAFSGALRLLG
jgi:hypothetical protein